VIRRYVGVVLLAATLLLGSGCEDLTVFLEDVYGVPAVSEEDRQDPAIEAAVQANQTIKQIEKADELLERGVETRNIDLIEEASRLRPRDARYQLYLAAAYAAQGDLGEYLRNLQESLKTIQFSHPHMSTVEHVHLWLSHGLEAMSDMLEGYEASPDRDFLRTRYCLMLDRYENGVGDIPGVGKSEWPHDFC
jgi:tetratricopeptide (TPR) repeat protein